MNKVAIIGAGASGIIAAKVLLDKGFAVTIFEKTNNIAGVWNFSDGGALYKSLKTNLPKEIMVFENEDVVYSSEESFIEFDQVRRYLVDNAESWGVDKYTYLNTEVTNLEPLENNSQKPIWRLGYIRDRQKSHQDFNYIVVCNGHYNKPKIPQDIQGLDKAKDYISHSKYYRSPQNHGKRILCVGYSSSGTDIAYELLKSGRKVYVALRDLKNSTSNHYTLSSKEGIEFISSPLKVIVTKDQCEVITNTGQSIIVDEIIFCTGYHYDFPFLSEDIISTQDNIVSPLFEQLLHKNYLNLAFIGLPWKTIPFILSESQAIFLAEFWQNNISSIAIIKNLQDNQNYQTSDKDTLRYHHMLGDQQWNYNLNLLNLVGQKTSKREDRIRLIENVYNDLNQIKNSFPFDFRKAKYNVDFASKKFTRNLDN